MVQSLGSQRCGRPLAGTTISNSKGKSNNTNTVVLLVTLMLCCSATTAQAQGQGKSPQGKTPGAQPACRPGKETTSPKPRSPSKYFFCDEQGNTAEITCPAGSVYDAKIESCSAPPSPALGPRAAANAAKQPVVVVKGFTWATYTFPCSSASELFQSVAALVSSPPGQIEEGNLAHNVQFVDDNGSLILEGNVTSLNFKKTLKKSSSFELVMSRELFDTMKFRNYTIGYKNEPLRVSFVGTNFDNWTSPACVFAARVADKELQDLVQTELEELSKKGRSLKGRSLQWKDCYAIQAGCLAAGAASCCAGCLVTGIFYPFCVSVCSKVAALACEGGNIACMGNPALSAPKKCFPGHAMVTAVGDQQVSMRSLSIGDKVLGARVGSSGAKAVWEDVYLWGHRDTNAWALFVSITTSRGAVVELTPGHYIPAQCHESASFQATRAEDVHIHCKVMVWDRSRSVFFQDVVERVENTWQQGLFNPFSLSGTIVVNDVLVSAHSEWFLEDVVPRAWAKHVPAFYQGIMAPARWVYFIVGPNAVRALDDKHDLSKAYGGEQGIMGYIQGIGVVLYAGTNGA